MRVSGDSSYPKRYAGEGVERQSNTRVLGRSYPGPAGFDPRPPLCFVLDSSVEGIEQ